MRQTDKESVQFLKSTGEKFMGSVLNYVDVSSMKL
jgi:hypothetical protein